RMEVLNCLPTTLAQLCPDYPGRDIRQTAGCNNHIVRSELQHRLCIGICVEAKHHTHLLAFSYSPIDNSYQITARGNAGGEANLTSRLGICFKHIDFVPPGG